MMLLSPGLFLGKLSRRTFGWMRVNISFSVGLVKIKYADKIQFFLNSINIEVGKYIFFEKKCKNVKRSVDLLVFCLYKRSCSAVGPIV